MKTGKIITSFDDHLYAKHGKKRTDTREKFQEARKSKNLTQQQLADKVGTTKNYISRIENNASNTRLSTLMRIIREGLGGSLKLSLDI